WTRSAHPGLVPSHPGSMPGRDGTRTRYPDPGSQSTHEAFHFCLIFSVFKEGRNSAILEVILNSCDTSFFDFLLIFLFFFLCLCSNSELEFELFSAISVSIA